MFGATTTYIMRLQRGSSRVVFNQIWDSIFGAFIIPRFRYIAERAPKNDNTTNKIVMPALTAERSGTEIAQNIGK